MSLLCVTLIGLFYSRFLISCGIIGLSLLWLAHPDKKSLLGLGWKNGLVISAWMIGCIYLLSGLNSDSPAGYWGEVKNKLPYLFIPFSMLGIPMLGSKEKRWLFLLFLLLILVSSGNTFYYFIRHRQDISEAYARGQILPTVIHHVSYSLLLVLAVLVTVQYALNCKNKWQLGLLLVVLAWLVFMIHLLATRTGLVCLYITLPVYLLTFAIQRKAYEVLALSLFAMIISGILFFLNTETLRNKMDYVRYDLGQIRQNINTDNQLSDSRRLLSDRLGWEIAREHPWAGVGIGDVKSEMKKLYDARYAYFDAETRGHIHNQFIYIFAGCGFILGTLFIVGIMIPLFYFFRHRYFLPGSAYLGVVLVLLWEPFLEYQLGNTIYLIILAIGINQSKRV